MHMPRHSRTTTNHPVPIVGCRVNNNSSFVLSWADIRCRSSTNARFPAECDGANERNLLIENATAAISLVDSLTSASKASVSGRRLDFGDADHEHVKGRRSAILVLISPSNVGDPLQEWRYGAIKDTWGNSPTRWAEEAVSRHANSPPAWP